MLSYQHGFHAGNFADVHKHFILSLIFAALNKKAKPWSYLETHGGAACYDFRSEQAQKTAEYRDGILKIWQQSETPEALAPYLNEVKALNGSGNLTLYPGSPQLAAQFAREGDKVAIMELHPGEYRQIKQHFSRNGQVAVHHRDGYEGVSALLPPKPNRGLVLIDPAYEVKAEYLQVAKYIKDAQQRWPNGSFAIWFPLLKAGQHQVMIDKIVASGIRRIFLSEFFAQPSDSARMFGSGMLLINPPWQLDQQIASVTPWLAQRLAMAGAEKPRETWLVPE